MRRFTIENLFNDSFLLLLHGACFSHFLMSISSSRCNSRFKTLSCVCDPDKVTRYSCLRFSYIYPLQRCVGQPFPSVHVHTVTISNDGVLIRRGTGKRERGNEGEQRPCCLHQSTQDQHRIEEHTLCTNAFSSPLHTLALWLVP